jgi:hypothetical protein
MDSTLRYIENATGVRREASGAYLKAAGIRCGTRGTAGWGSQIPPSGGA